MIYGKFKSRYGTELRGHLNSEVPKANKHDILFFLVFSRVMPTIIFTFTSAVQSGR